MTPHPAVNETAYGTVETVTEVATGDSKTKTDGSSKAKNDTEMAVRDYFSDIPVMIQIARCESQFRHTLADGTILRGKVDPRDMGVMQINTGFHAAEAKQLGLDLSDIHDNMAFARHLYEKQGTQPWKASSQCWNSSVAMR